MFYTCTFQKETWNFVNKYNNFLKRCRAPEPDTYSMLLPSCGHLEHRSSSLSKPCSSDGFQSCMGGLRIPAPGLHILRGSDFSSICSKPTRPRPMLWSWLCNSLFTLETTSIPAVLLTWLSQPRWTPLSLWEVPGTSALHWPPREAAEVGAALTSARPTLTLLFNTLSETDCGAWGSAGGGGAGVAALHYPFVFSILCCRDTGDPAGTSLCQLLTLQSSHVNKQSSTLTHTPLPPQLVPVLALFCFCSQYLQVQFPRSPQSVSPAVYGGGGRAVQAGTRTVLLKTWWWS